MAFDHPINSGFQPMRDQPAEEMDITSKIPTDKVLMMRGQGLSNNQIIATLQRDGHETPDIFHALSQADMKEGIENPSAGFTGADLQNPMQMQGMYPNQNQMPGQDQGMGMQYGQNPAWQDPGQMQQGMPPGYEPQQMQQSGPSMDSTMGNQFSERERIEELAEAIIDEKWNEIVRSINKIVDWKERIEGRITKIEQQIADMSKSFDALHTGVLGKVNEYDKNLSNIGTDLQAMEKVFQKVLPTLTENVSELSRITDQMKGKM